MSFVPLLGLGFFYLQAARRNGPMRPVWENLSNPWSPAAWGARLGWVDPITLAIKDGLPFTEPGQSRFRCVRAGSLAGAFRGALVVRADFEPGRELSAQELANDPDGRKTLARRGARDDRQGLVASGRVAHGRLESSDRTRSARPTENSFRSGWCFWA